MSTQSSDFLDSPDAGASAVRGGTLRIAGYLVGIALSVVSSALLFRHLGIVDSGRYVLVLSLILIGFTLSEGGLSTYGVRELSLRPPGPERTQLLRNLLGLRFALTAVGVLAAVAYAVADSYSSTLIIGCLVVGGAVLIQGIQSTLATVLAVRMELGWVSALDLTRQGLTALGIIVLALAGASLELFFWVSFVAAVVVLAATVVRLWGQVPLLPALSWSIWRQVLVSVFPIAVAIAVVSLYFRVNVLMVQILSNEHEVGLFGASFRIVEVLVLIPGLIAASALPIYTRAARDDAVRLRYALQRTLDSCVLLGGAMLVGLVAGAPLVLAVLGGQEFDGATPILRLHAIGIFLSCASIVFIYGLLALRQYRIVLYAGLVGLAINLIATSLLIPDHGGEGGAIATLFAEFSIALMTWLALMRTTLEVRLSLVSTGRAAVIAGLCLLPMLVFGPVPATLIGVTMFAGLALVSGAVPEELLEEARKVMHKISQAGGKHS